MDNRQSPKSCASQELCQANGCFLANNPAEFDPRKYLAETTKAMRDIAIARYEAFGAAGQAGKIKPLSMEAMFQRYESGELYK